MIIGRKRETGQEKERSSGRVRFREWRRGRGVFSNLWVMRYASSMGWVELDDWRGCWRTSCTLKDPDHTSTRQTAVEKEAACLSDGSAAWHPTALQWQRGLSVWLTPPWLHEEIPRELHAAQCQPIPMLRTGHNDRCCCANQPFVSAAASMLRLRRCQGALRTFLIFLSVGRQIVSLPPLMRPSPMPHALNGKKNTTVTSALVASVFKRDQV